jgi:hypothetical protein
MEKTGRLKLSNGEARVNGTLLARKGADDPLGAAADFMTNQGLRDGQCVTVTGESGTVGDKAVLFVDSAKAADETLCGGAPAGAFTERVAALAPTSTRSPVQPAKKKGRKAKAKSAKRSKGKSAKKAKKQKANKPKGSKKKAQKRRS